MLRVLTYHQILPEAISGAPSPVSVSATPQAFEQQMRHVSLHYEVVPMEDVLQVLDGGLLLRAFRW